MIVEFIKYAGFVFLILLILLAPIHFAIIKSKSKASYAFTFIVSLLLLFVTIVIYSICYTKFKTVYILSLPLLGFILYRLFKQDHFEVTWVTEGARESNTKHFIVLISSVFIATLSIYIIQLLFPYPESINHNILFYTKIAENLSLSGNENTFQHYNGQAAHFSGTFPYHYFELWFSNLLFKLFPSISTVVVIKYITYPLLKILGIWGVWTILKNRNRHQLYLIPLVALLSTLPLHKILDLAGNSWGIYTDVWIRPNFITYFLFLIPAIYFILQKQYYTLVIWLLFLPLISTTTAPAIYTSLTILVAIMRWRKIFTVNQTAVLGSIIILSAALLLLFYFTTSANLSASVDTPNGAGYFIDEIIRLWKAILFMSATLTLRVALFTGLIIGIAYFTIKRDSAHFQSLIQFALIAFLFSFTGILLFQLVPSVDNTYQFPYIGYTALHLSTIYFFILLINKKSSRLTPFVLILPAVVWVGINLYRVTDLLVFESASSVHYNLAKQGYSNQSISDLEEFFKKHPKAQGAYYITKETLSSIPPKKRHALTFQPGDEINYLINYSTLFPITPDSILYSDFQHEPEAHAKAKSFNNKIASYDLINNESAKSALKMLKCDFLISTDVLVENYLTPITHTKNLYFYEISIE